MGTPSISSLSGLAEDHPLDLVAKGGELHCSWRVFYMFRLFESLLLFMFSGCFADMTSFAKFGRRESDSPADSWSGGHKLGECPKSLDCFWQGLLLLGCIWGCRKGNMQPTILVESTVNGFCVLLILHCVFKTWGASNSVGYLLEKIQSATQEVSRLCLMYVWNSISWVTL